ncbi:MAG TPA: cyclodeaminase/cyclohydrolase family protein [Opitutales bacterium]|nr:cyclodeaminase/cyclohydrolase family protein [Opitutales bacterium]
MSATIPLTAEKNDSIKLAVDLETADFSKIDLLKLQFGQFLIAFGRGKATPGIGSANAATAAICCALLKTVCTLTLNHRRVDQERKDRVRRFYTGILCPNEPNVRDTIQRDTVVFNGYIQHLKAYNAASEDNVRRYHAHNMLLELRPATDLPLKLAGWCLDIAEGGVELFDNLLETARGDSLGSLKGLAKTAEDSTYLVYLNLDESDNIKAKNKIELDEAWWTQKFQHAEAIDKRRKALQSRLNEKSDSLKQAISMNHGLV